MKVEFIVNNKSWASFTHNREVVRIKISEEFKNLKITKNLSNNTLYMLINKKITTISLEFLKIIDYFGIKDDYYREIMTFIDNMM